MTTSLSKGVAVLGVLAAASDPLSVRRVAVNCALSKSTVHRLLGELESAGWVEATPDGYRLGLRLFELGGAALHQNNLVEIAQPLMEELYEQSRCLVQLAVLQGTDVLYLARVGRQGHQRVASLVGGRIPASCTAVGKALLAHHPDTLELAVRQGLERRTRRSLTDPSALRTALSFVRKSGVAIELEEARAGLACVASPVIRDGRCRAALSLTTSVKEFEPKRLGLAVRRAATQLAARLES